MVLAAVVALLAARGAHALDAAAGAKLFERIFGENGVIPEDIRAKVLTLHEGERLYLDPDGDGRPEEVWFIDTAARHPEEMRPVLVHAIDEDGDLKPGGDPDQDGDLYIVDWKADGSINAALDYTDVDGDGDLDEMAFFYLWGGRSGKETKMMSWWGEDTGDDNLLWYDVGYTYRQDDCQTRSHFGGNEMFNAYLLGENDTEWVPALENPFVFYDHDFDGVTEEVIRIEGEGWRIDNLRHSFDADNDATPGQPRDFDVSLSAHAPEGLRVPEQLADRRMLRGIPTGPFLSYASVPDFARKTGWASYLLSWVEDDLNMDRVDVRDGKFLDTQERWEGVIAAGNPDFKQIGGPHAGTLNIRYEVNPKGNGPIRVYWSRADARLHLFGATKRWIDVDLNYDLAPECRYEIADKDGDGYGETWSLDANLDGIAEETWAVTGGFEDIPYTWSEINALVREALASQPEAWLRLYGTLGRALEKNGITAQRGAFEDAFSGTPLADVVRRRLAASVPSLRFFLQVGSDLRTIALRAKTGDQAFWAEFDAKRAAGDVNGMAACVEQAFALEERDIAFDAFQQGIQALVAQPRVAWAQDWVPPNIGWESEQAAYRVYWGQFDFFGKMGARLVYPAIADQKNYHAEGDWGMDALHVGDSCGLGGLTLFVDGQPYPVWSPRGEGAIVWTKKLVEAADDRIVVALTAENVGPAASPFTVRYTCTAVADRPDSPIEVTLEGGPENAALEVGIGIEKLGDETWTLDTAHGVLASWGMQERAIGTVGLGVVFPKAAYRRVVDTPDSHCVVLDAQRGTPIAYHIRATWLRGRRFPCTPTLENWTQELRTTALLGNE